MQKRQKLVGNDVSMFILNEAHSGWISDMKTDTGSLFGREVGERQREAMTQAVKG